MSNLLSSKFARSRLKRKLILPAGSQQTNVPDMRRTRTHTTHTDEPDLISDTEAVADSISEISSLSGSEDYELSRFLLSDDDESSSNDEELKDNNDLSYQLLYDGSRLLRAESNALLCNLRAKHRMSNVAFEAVIKIISFHLPAHAIFPTSLHTFQKQLNIQRNWSKRIYYCKACNQRLEDNKQCQTCTVASQSNYFTVFNVRKQLECIFSKNCIVQMVSESFKTRHQVNNNFSEITDGGMYALIRSKEYRDITCTFNSDGVSIFKSSKFSAWPVLAMINELSYSVRRKHVLIIGLWLSDVKPKVSLFFEEIVRVMNDLSKNGFDWKLENGMVVNTKVFFTNCTADSPARCLLQGNKQFNGKFGCNWCTNPGERVVKGKGYCRVYSLDTNSTLRSGEIYKNNALSGIFEDGIKMASPFLQLESFDIVNGFTVDVMHCVYLGIVRTITNLWLESSQCEYYLGKDLTALDNVLLNCKTPSEICRNFRSITTSKYWKATEWRSWLFVAPIVLKTLLPTRYLKHFQKLSLIIYNVTSTDIDDVALIDTNTLVHRFTTTMETLYGKNNLSYNVHQLSHLVKSVQNWGPSWGTSAFPFEAFNGQILRYVKSSNAVDLQISRSFSSDHQVSEKTEKVYNQAYNAPIDNYGKSKLELVKLKPLDGSNINLQACGHNEMCKVVGSCFKAVCKGMKLNNKEYTKRCDNYTLVSDTVIGRVLEFVRVSCECQSDVQLFDMCLLETIKVKQMKLYKICYYCHTNTSRETFLCHVESMKFAKLFKITKESKMYFVKVPNLIEVE